NALEHLGRTRVEQFAAPRGLDLRQQVVRAEPALLRPRKVVDDPPLVHHDEPVAEGRRLLHRVRHHQGRQPVAPAGGAGASDQVPQPAKPSEPAKAWAGLDGFFAGTMTGGRRGCVWAGPPFCSPVGRLSPPDVAGADWTSSSSIDRLDQILDGLGEAITEVVG